jgi:hypothetical protein
MRQAVVAFVGKNNKVKTAKKGGGGVKKNLKMLRVNLIQKLKVYD